MKERLIKIVAIALLCIAAVALPFVVFGENGLPLVHRLDSQVKRIQEKNRGVQWEIMELGREIQDFRDNPQLIKQVAREELGYVTSDEVVFIVP